MPGFLFMGIVDIEGDKSLSEPAQPPPTTTFARSRLPRSLLIAHFAVTGVWYFNNPKSQKRFLRCRTELATNR
jgi:hypothetical protein